MIITMALASGSLANTSVLTWNPKLTSYSFVQAVEYDLLLWSLVIIQGVSMEKAGCQGNSCRVFITCWRGWYWLWSIVSVTVGSHTNYSLTQENVPAYITKTRYEVQIEYDGNWGNQNCWWQDCCVVSCAVDFMTSSLPWQQVEVS